MKTHILGSVTFFENCALYEIMGENMVQPDRSQMRITCWIPKGTNTHSDYVLRIAFQDNSFCTNVSQCYVISSFPVLVILANVNVQKLIY